MLESQTERGIGVRDWIIPLTDWPRGVLFGGGKYQAVLTTDGSGGILTNSSSSRSKTSELEGVIQLQQETRKNPPTTP